MPRYKRYNVTPAPYVNMPASADPGQQATPNAILYPQCFDWNAKPLRGGGAFRKQRNMQWRMVS
jgi:hypothetical protein